MAASRIGYDEVCEKCRSIFPGVFSTRYPKTATHLTVGELQESSEKGCHACNLIIALLKNNPDCAENIDSPLNLAWDVQLALRCDRGRYLYVVAEHDEKIYGNFLVRYQQDAQPENRPENLEMTAASAAHLVQKWLVDCEGGHPSSSHSSSCGSQSRPKLPTRLLKIARDSGSTTVKVRLVYTNALDVSTRCTTLSYCWGGDVPCKCTSGNIFNYLEDIPFDALPLTIKEAILLTESFGICYIWVDSLCIIQDNPSDWKAEATQMSHVYSNSSLNITADAATNSGGGLFTTRNPLNFSVCKISPIIFWRSPTEDMKYRQPPIYTRGWCLQERYLSPRTIHFGFEQMYWECATCYKIEGFPSDNSITFGAQKLLYQKEGEMAWENLITVYSDSRLTKSSDKLIAIAALASKFGEIHGPDFKVGNYLAGIWHTCLPRALLWYNGSSHLDNPYGGPYRAPSWSWASIDGSFRIYPLFDTNALVIEVLQAEIFPTSLISPERGYLRIRGPICSAASISAFHSQSCPDGASQPGTIICEDSLNLSVTFRLDNRPAVELASRDPYRVYMLPVSGMYHQFSGGVGILLQRVEDGEPGQYRRLGLFWFDADRESTRWNRLIVHCGSVPLDESVYKCRDQAGRCVIEII